jgi:hypothetical protein
MMKTLRLKAGLHIGEVARELAVHRNTVKRWESGGGKRGIPRSVVREFGRLMSNLERINYLRASRRRIRRIRGAE